MAQALPMPPTLRWPLMLLPFVLWGTAMVAMKPLLAGAAPITLAWLRLLPAGVVVLLVARGFGRYAQVLPAQVQADLKQT